MADTIVMARGDTKVFTLTLYDEDGSTPYSAAAATTIIMTVKTGVDAGSATFTVTLADGDIVVSGAGNNVLTVTIKPTKTTSLLLTGGSVSYIWDIEVKHSSTVVQTFPRSAAGNYEAGVLTVNADLTV